MCCVDIVNYIFSNKKKIHVFLTVSVDVMCVPFCSPACIAKFSSGQIYYHPDFHSKNKVSSEKFEEGLKYVMTVHLIP